MLARSVMCYFLLCSRVFQQSNRNMLSPLLVFMGSELDITIQEKGSLLSAIAAGYFFTQVPGGALGDLLGAKNVMTLALFLSACCVLIVPSAVDAFGVRGLYYTFFVMGAVQGPLFPCSSVFLSRWMPNKTDGSDEKAWGTSMLDIGISVGSLIIIPVANTLGAFVGWRQTCRILGLCSLFFVAVWHFVTAESPRECWFISEGESEFLAKHITASSKRSTGDSESAKKSSGGLLDMPASVGLHRGVWAVFICHIAFNNGAYYLTNWSPTYYSEVLRVPPTEATYHMMLPHVANLAAKATVPALVALVARRGYSLITSRKLFTVAGFVISAAALLPVHQLHEANPWYSTALFCITNTFFGISPSGWRANYLDITETYVGIISGYGNTLGTVASWFGPQLVVFLLHKFGSWDLVLASVGAINVLASLNYMRNAVASPVEHAAVESTGLKEDIPYEAAARALAPWDVQVSTGVPESGSDERV